MDAATLAWLDQEDAHVGAIIRRYGWFIQYVGGTEHCTLPGCCCFEDEDPLPFAYTVGLFGLNHRGAIRSESPGAAHLWGAARDGRWGP
jgi:hypothetical protein